jgi:predicted metal-dependent HD superfamily phosphohydrolase/GrpB-like predicted nucleotidyltransferase (UPF0157 family)
MIERSIGPYENRAAVCQKYDPRAAEVAQRVAANIRSYLPGVVVEHIGSTSVPGCAGKGIVDLMLPYADGQLAAVRDALDTLGFQKQTTRDPFPEDRPMRTGSVVHDGTTFQLHVHVIAASSPEAEELRCFRDRLRGDPNLVASYVAAKKAILAGGVTDSVDYCVRKGQFVQQALHAGGNPGQLNRSYEMRSSWQQLLGAWAVDPALADPAFEDICKHYAEPGRFYHTLNHVQNLLETVESLGLHARNTNAVKLAGWLHDVIYDSRASDNEERSAEYAEQLCGKLSIPEGPLVASLILKTKTHDAGADPDAQVLIDADLAILGASESAYWAYAEQIRQEYAWVRELEYRIGRRRVLASFLSRPRIYHFLSNLEQPARCNIAAEIARLEVA